MPLEINQNGVRVAGDAGDASRHHPYAKGYIEEAPSALRISAGLEEIALAFEVNLHARFCLTASTHSRMIAAKIGTANELPVIRKRSHSDEGWASTYADADEPVLKPSILSRSSAESGRMNLSQPFT